MATALIASRTSKFGVWLDAYHRWRWAKARKVCVRYATDAADYGADAQRLLNLQHYRAAVFMARLHLEKELGEMSEGLSGERPFFGRHYAILLRSHDRITTAQANRIGAVYTRASRVVHGSACSPGRAVGILGDISCLIGQLRSVAVKGCNHV